VQIASLLLADKSNVLCYALVSSSPEAQIASLLLACWDDGHTDPWLI
jgi:hypothetical protein